MSLFSKKKTDSDDFFDEMKSFLDSDDGLFEQLVGFEYINQQGKKINEYKSLGNRYLPIIGEELTENQEVVLLPSNIDDYDSTRDLIEDIKNHIYMYFDCSDRVRSICAWYILLTWVYDRLNTIPYLRALGDWGTGKSRFLDVVGRLCYKATIGSGAGSMAALKRMVKKWKGTVLTDEGDFKQDDEKSDLVKFYNLGFEKNRPIFQCDKNDPNKIEFYHPYCPKIITTRQQFKDKALESRCITFTTKTTRRKEIPSYLPSVFHTEQERLRNKLLMFRFKNYSKIDPDKALEIDLGDNIEPRLKQSMLGFTVLFANMPDMFEEFKEHIQKHQEELIEDRSTSFDGQIVNVIADLLISGNENITSKDIAEMISTDKFIVKPNLIGTHLRQLGITTKPKKIDGKTKRILVFNEDIKTVFKRYISEKDKVTAVTAVTAVTKTCSDTQLQVDIINNNKNEGPVTDVTDVTDVTFEDVEKDDLIHHKCFICGKSPCIKYNRIGKPLCEDCYNDIPNQ